jgi:hypothetical protein
MFTTDHAIFSKVVTIIRCCSGGNRSPWEKPTIFGRALTFTLFTRGLGSSRTEKVLTEA